MKTLTINQMTCLESGCVEHAGCVGAMAVAGAVWDVAIGAVTGGIGSVIFGVAWAYFSDYVCGQVE